MHLARRAVAVLVLAALPACGSSRVFECSRDDQCVLGGVSGRCEASGYCSLPDGSCPDGFRYVDEAPEPLAGACVGEIAAGGDGGPGGGCVVAIAAGARHSCAIDQEGAVWCWGDNSDLALGSAGGSTATPRQVSGLPGAAAELAAGDRHTCAVVEPDREVVCWGANDRGQLGTGATGAAALPGAKLVDSGAARGLSAGGGHSCAVDDDDTAWCWGDNRSGEVAPGAPESVPYPEDPLGLLDCAVAVAAGGRHSMAMLDDNSIVTWGEADAPALGRGSPAPGDPYMIIVDWFEPSSIAAGAEHSCGIGIDRGVRCWGVAQDGRLGVDGDDRDRPVDIGLDADRVRPGGRHTCALDGSELVCWGANDSGQLGVAGASGPEPRQVPGSWTAVASGGEHTCAIAASGLVFCWGANDAGQLGVDGGSTSEPQMVPLPCP
jgi:alpha-tubulin suppressor-like RCC1 family protein